MKLKSLITEGPGNISKSTSPERNILNVISRSDFEKWYKTDFKKFIKGTPNSKDTAKILSDIRNMFKV